MSNAEPPPPGEQPSPGPGGYGSGDDSYTGSWDENPFGAVPLSPLLAEDSPKVGDFWLDARLHATNSGVAYTAHDADDTPAMLILLSQGAAADAAARDRLAGVVNAMYIDTVLARGGQGQDSGKFARKFRPEDDDPVAPNDQQAAPWVALAYDGSPQAADEALRVFERGPAEHVQPARQPVRARLSALLAGPVQTRAGPALAAALAGSLRPGGLADDPGLLAADAVARRARGADRHPDLPQSASAGPADPDRRLRQPSTAVRLALTPVRLALAAVRIPVAAVRLTLTAVGVTVAVELRQPEQFG